MNGAIADGLPREPASSPSRLAEAWPVFVRHGSPRILLVALAAALVWRVSLGRWSAWDLVPAAAVLAFWPLQEWLIHVLVLHYRPVRWLGRTWDFRVPRSHRAHHLDPWNYEILFIPPHTFLYTLPILVGFWLVVAPTRAVAATGIAVHLALTLHYEAVHFLIHTRVTPPAGYRRLWRNHRRHHFKNERYWYGVTRLAADRWLGTAPAFRSVPTSPTARSLETVSPRAA
jgi:Fatty acid hydroxylase